MDAVAWIFAGAFLFTQLLLIVAVDAHSDLAKQNRDLRRQLVKAQQRPALRAVGPDGGAA